MVAKKWVEAVEAMLSRGSWPVQKVTNRAGYARWREARAWWRRQESAPEGVERLRIRVTEVEDGLLVLSFDLKEVQEMVEVAFVEQFEEIEMTQSKKLAAYPRYMRALCSPKAYVNGPRETGEMPKASAMTARLQFYSFRNALRAEVQRHKNYELAEALAIADSVRIRLVPTSEEKVKMIYGLRDQVKDAHDGVIEDAFADIVEGSLRESNEAEEKAKEQEKLLKGLLD